MTIPVFSGTCDRCGFTDSGGYTGGREYALPDGGVLPLRSRLGWCLDCGKLESIENVDPAQWLEEIAFIRDRIASVRSEKRLLSKRWTYDGRYFDFDSDFRSEITTDTFVDWAQRIDQALTGFRVMSERSTPPKCLSCGGIRFEPAEYRTNPVDPESRQLIHRGCGGVFSSEWVGDFFVKGPRSIRRYSIEGDFLGWYREGVRVDAT